MTKDELFQDRRFFFDTRQMKETAEYALKYSPYEAEKVLGTADAAVSQSYIFTLRWDLEQTQVPVVFEGDIDWFRQPGDDAEFVYAFNRMRHWICFGEAYAMTGDEKYARAFAKELLSWTENVQKSDPACQKAWRTIEAGFRMEYWSKAIQFFRSSENLTDDVVDAFVLSMKEHAEFIMGVWDSYNKLSNWGIIANHGLFEASVILPESEQTMRWRSEALRRLDEELRMQVYDDGVHWEQSAMYHNEVLQCFQDVLILSRHCGIELPEGMEERIYKLAYASAIMQKPNGSEPMSGDSDDIDQRDLTEKSAWLFSSPLFRSLGEDHMTFDALWDTGLDAALEYEAIKGEKPSDLVFSFPDSGRAVYRNDRTYLLFKNGTLGAGHGHADQTHFDLFYNGEDILVDPGRFTYVDKAERYEFKDSYAHNVITIDGENSYKASDSWAYSKMSRAYGFSVKEKDGSAFIAGGHLGYYGRGVFISRKIIVLSDTLIAIADEFYSDGKHEAALNLHFSETGAVSTDGVDRISFRSDRNNAGILVLGGERTEVYSSRISRHYNQASPNQSTRTYCTFDGFGSLLTVIDLSGKADAEPAELLSNYYSRPIDKTAAEGYQIGDYYLVVGHYEWGSPTDSFSIAGHDGWGQTVVFKPGDGDIGTVLEY